MFCERNAKEPDPDETSEDLKDECIDINEVVNVVVGNCENQMPDSKSAQDVTENNDDKVFDAKVEKSCLSCKAAKIDSENGDQLDKEIDDDEGMDVEVDNSKSCEESIAMVNEDTNDEVCGYDEISVNENDDQLNYEVDEDTEDEVRGFKEIKVKENEDQIT